jgi:DnaJ-class molecular chaperone
MHAKQEKDFQTQANDYANCSLESIREMLDAVGHARECTGEMGCPDCEGTGSTENGFKDCTKCNATGEIIAIGSANQLTTSYSTG